MSTAAKMRELEACGFQFLRDDAGWALYDLDDRSEVPGSRSARLGDSVWQAAATLDMDTVE